VYDIQGKFEEAYQLSQWGNLQPKWHLTLSIMPESKIKMLHLEYQELNKSSA